MGIDLTTNMDSAAAIRFLDKTSRAQSKNISRLSSGLRVNVDADDSAGLAISEQLKGQVRGLAQASRNGQDGVSMIQIAEGALNEIHGALARMRELAVQAANQTQTAQTRSYIDIEYQSLKNDIDRIVDSTDFNGQKLLNTVSQFTFQVGAGALTAENAITVTISDMSSSSLGGAVVGTSLAGTTVSTMSQALNAISSLDRAITDVSSQRSTIGVSQNRLLLALDSVNATRENLIAVNSRIRDADVANESSDFTRHQILSQAAVSVLAQANRLPSYGLQLIG